MMRLFSHFIALAILGAVAGLGQAMERVAIPGLDGKLELPAYWFPSVAAGPRPTIISLHGCGGALNARQNLNPAYFRDATSFNAEHMHLLVIDSFTPRGVKSICEIARAQRVLSEEDRRDDVYAAIRWLAHQPGVDTSRIVVMGRSHGGQTVLSVIDRTDKAVQAQTIHPRAAIALYPGCSLVLRRWNYELSSPLLLMIGESDDWTPARNCVQLRDKVIRAQADAVFDMHVFPGSFHGFDGLAPVRTRKDVASTRSGTATVGGNPEAREKAHRLMFEFLSRELGVPLRLSHEERYAGQAAPKER